MGCQVVPPLFVDCHRLNSGFLALLREPLCLGVLDHLPDMVRVHGVQHCEEVVPIGISVSWILILQILHHLGVPLELRIDIFYR